MKTFLSNLAALFVFIATFFDGSMRALGQTAASTADLAQLEASFSGTATYTQTFQWLPALPAGTLPKEYCWNSATCRSWRGSSSTGMTRVVLWRPPFRTEITRALVPGRNTLKIAVANLWPNRMVAEAALPSNQRFTWSSDEPFNKDTPLLPSGLLGPVTISAAGPVALER